MVGAATSRSENHCEQLDSVAFTQYLKEFFACYPFGEKLGFQLSLLLTVTEIS